MRDRTDVPATLIQVGKDIVFDGYWRGAEANNWLFEVVHYLYGDDLHMRDYCSEFARSKEWDRFVVVESQGDGRLISSAPSWTADDGRTLVSVQVSEKQPCVDPKTLGGTIAVDMETGDWMVENGSYKVVSGLQNAIQRLSYVLSSKYQLVLKGCVAGSLFGKYYSDHRGDKPVLERLLRLEISRLATIPTLGWPLDSTAPFCFVRRIHDLEIEETDPAGSLLHVALKLEWGNGDMWSGKVCVSVRPRS